MYVYILFTESEMTDHGLFSITSSEISKLTQNIDSSVRGGGEHRRKEKFNSSGFFPPWKVLDFDGNCILHLPL